MGGIITRVLVGAMVIEEDKVLLLKRAESKKFLPGHWDVPGGKVEPGEDPIVALERELFEETGLELAKAEPFNVWSEVLDFDGKKEHLIEIDYLVKVKRPSLLVLSEKEHVDHGYFEKDHLPEQITNSLKKSVLKSFEKQ